MRDDSSDAPNQTASPMTPPHTRGPRGFTRGIDVIYASSRETAIGSRPVAESYTTFPCALANHFFVEGSEPRATLSARNPSRIVGGFRCTFVAGRVGAGRPYNHVTLGT